jgi:hypothetical protein
MSDGSYSFNETTFIYFLAKKYTEGSRLLS